MHETSLIREEIERARSVIEGLRSSPARVTEADTIRKLIMPMLETLGWDIRNFSEIREQVVSAGGSRADISCNLTGGVVMFVEAKAIGESIDDPKYISQALKYGTDEGANWCILTNGWIWAIYHANAPGKASDKLFRRVDLTKSFEDPHTSESLLLLTKEAMKDRQIDRAWKLEHNNRQVETALRALLSEDERFIKLLRKRIQDEGGDLSPKDIRDTLMRFSIRINTDNVNGEESTTRRIDPPAEENFSISRMEEGLDQEDCNASGNALTKQKQRRPRIADMIEAGLLQPGQSFRLRTRPDSVATIIDGRTCEYRGEHELQPVRNQGNRLACDPDIHSS